ncbi:helicase with zinc finger domain 2 isoform X1 [Esox lucius]|uniref:C3H1-type domain-containing protein n=1 Tax=Esox lucius TaxID=8010 RepID=A0A3P8Y919_ESOLU|nr:helicase with zinc finger domain 2 isoform X1 [Esox lucius]XP_034142929.1 helicase with zinc finger domain 2 isoform X1 [Esox lucius]
MEVNNLFEPHNLYLGCNLCCKQESEITYSLNNIQNHDCTMAILLARKKDSTEKWRVVSQPPLFPRPERYAKCLHYTEGQGCTQHRNGCSFARSSEEAAAWNFLKHTESPLLLSWLKKGRGPPPLVKSLSPKDSIQRKFPGTFMELCETCFHLSPREIFVRASNSRCNSRHKHPWRATLVLRQCDTQKTPSYEEVRPLPVLPFIKPQSWQYCRFIKKGEKCIHGAHRCWFAHNTVEMAVWTAEEQGLARSELLREVQRTQRLLVSPSHRTHDCKVCNASFTSWGCFQNHLNTMDHINRTNDFNNVTKTEWKCRDPPQMNKAYKLCERASTCEFGSNCVDAHSVAELQEWRTRDKTERKTAIVAEEQGLLSYQDLLLREYRESVNKALIVSDRVSGVSVVCDKDLIISCQSEKVPVKWNFRIQSERLLANVALLKQEPGASFSLDGNSLEPCTYSTGEHFCNSDMTYDITVSFESIHPGLYEQWLVLDFDMRPVLLQKLKVKVGQQPLCDLEEPPEDVGLPSQNLERWHQGNRVIILCLDKTEAQEELLNEYKPPQISFQYKPCDDSNTPMNHENYKERMHSFLYSEEQAEDQVVSRLNLQGTMTLSATLNNENFGMKIAPLGELFCAISVTYSLTPDTPEGLMLRRGILSALIAPVSSDHQSPNVYEAIILRDATSENKMHLQLSKRCCTDLKLQRNETREMEVQFQLNRLMFCGMHKAIDLLPDTERVLPDFRNCTIPMKKNLQKSNLNARQQAALEFIVGETDGGSVAPFLIYGPFGTGKTFTLATAAKELLRQPHTRVLICTLTNSSADLYVSGHLHESIISGDLEIKLLRIKAEEASVKSTDCITLQYCHLSNNGQLFCLPDKDAVVSCRVVITTTAMAKHLHDLKLSDGYFTHILIDEASQMLECEALMPLGLAGPLTRVVLAGDHMQMGPKLFSVDDDQRSNHTLLNRLFHYYQAQESGAALKSRIIFNENYRSTKEIVEFVSTNFYVGKSDAIKAVGDVPGHPNSHALRFHHVRGESHLDNTSMSWFNMEEAACVVEIVQSLLRDWPNTWGIQDQRSICVLSEGIQVSLIRKEFRRRNLGQVTVENIANVQGKQFRAIVLTAVQTRDSLFSSDSPCHEFFNDARVLNTAMTRAQSQVIVVGDGAALCYFGGSSRIWKAYIVHCIRNHSATLTEDDLKRELREISRFVRVDEEDSDCESSISEIPDMDDPILKELLDEGKDVRVTVTAEGLLSITRGDLIVNPLDGFQKTNQDIAPLQALKRDPGIYKHCLLVLEWFDSGYAIPLEEPSFKISIKGRKNIGRSFPGDQVIVEILDNKCQPPSGKVLDVVKVQNASKMFVCTADIYDRQVMTPINKCVSKIYTPFWKDKPNYIAVRKMDDLRIEKFVKINEESKRNNIFVVKVLKWREHFRLPLGVVVKVLPKVASLDSGLEVLDIEYQLTRDPPVENDANILKELNTDMQIREDYRELTTFTIDPAHSKDLDDAISVRDLGEHYEIGVHIADVASLVTKDSQLDKDAQQNGTAFYPPEKEPVYMFPYCLSTKYFSLHPGCERNAISLMVEIDKKTDRIKTQTFKLSVIKSDRKLSYEDAENIIQNSADSTQQYDTLEGCLSKAFHFSEIHRKDRKLEDRFYKSPDDDVTVGRRCSHKMVEELMVMYNHAVTEMLLKDSKTVSCTPVRCQDKPDPQKLCQLKEKYGLWIPLSIHLGHCISQAVNIDDNQRDLMSKHTLEARKEKGKHQGQAVQTPETFSLLTSIWRSLKSALQEQDVHRIVDLIATDDIHPQLLTLILEFRKTIHRAHILCSNSTYLSRVGHYDLQLESYTWASSPIRRYVDVMVQRLLHSVLEKKEVNYTSLEIGQSCLSFGEKSEKQKRYERSSRCLHLASQLNDQSARKLAFVIEASRVGKGLRVYFPLSRSSMPEAIPIMYRDLQLTDQPEYNNNDNHVILKWKKRVYSITNENIHAELQQQGPNPFVIPVPTDLWERTVLALKEENWDSMFQSLQTINSHVNHRKPLGTGPPHHAPMVGANQHQGHYVEMLLTVKPGETLEVQLGCETERGLLIPVVHMLIVRDKFEICLQHSKDPTQCFSKYATYSSKQRYATYMEYQKIWKPLCEMESASNAVAENDSVVLEDVPLTWKPKQKNGQLRGFFRLPLEKMKQWAIEYGLRHSFLCVRMRYQHVAELQRNGDCEHVDFNNIPSLIWVAHGITTRVTDEEKAETLSYVQIDFQINHMSFAKIPERVFWTKTRFTVELIPKLLPDVRKEAAISSLTQANQLVKDIAIGKRTNFAPVPNQLTTARFEIKCHTSVQFPDLNNSQTKAIKEALGNRFTLIQGPPGTGKTVVGVHIVYWFFQQNQKVQTQLRPKADKSSSKRRCILYCGPSNKSVDVVAGQLLKLRGVLKPLRVYSEQVEMLEFPYPGSTLRLSRRSIREERTNRDLQSITLHHLIRTPDNPFSREIICFDKRIKLEEELTDKEIKSYKSILSKARNYELLRHDVILCTCTAASNPNFSKLDLQQIVIDECAMATEPEAFIPLVTHKPEQIVLLGDHKQLQPITCSDLAAKLGMRQSLFERYMEKALMLDTQYRMHERICEFPSKEFYKGLLKTGVNRKASVLLTQSKHPTPILFRHVNGKEISLVVSTDKGNENSKANVEEAQESVRIALLLIRQARVAPCDIAILTPYNAQVAEVNETLSRNGIQNVTVCTITKSQGSEWRYVILSTVRSCPKSEIDTEPTKAWLTKMLGFLIDPNQVNVGITRAQEGLCIIGNHDLLGSSSLWRRLLIHYQQCGCVVDSAQEVQVQRSRH